MHGGLSTPVVGDRDFLFIFLELIRYSYASLPSRRDKEGVVIGKSASGGTSLIGSHYAMRVPQYCKGEQSCTSKYSLPETGPLRVSTPHGSLPLLRMFGAFRIWNCSLRRTLTEEVGAIYQL